MERQSTLILLGINTQLELYEKMVINYITRIVPIIERSAREIDGDIFVMIDETVPEDFSDMLTLVSTAKRKYQFVQEESGEKTLQRVRGHFTEFPGSILVLLTEKDTAVTLGAKINMQEAAAPKLFLDVIELPT